MRRSCYNVKEATDRGGIGRLVGRRWERCTPRAAQREDTRRPYETGWQRHRIGGLLLGFIVSLFLCAACTASEFQFWHGATAAVNLAEQWKAKLGAQARYDDRGSLVRHHADIGVVYGGLADWLDLGLSYRTIAREFDRDEWQNANRIYLDVTTRARWMGIAFSNRVRSEYSDFEEFGDWGTVRNRITFNPPFELEPDRERSILGHYKMRPYGGYEIFYDTLGDKVTRHRFQAGFSIVFTDRIVGDISFIRENRTSQIDLDDLNIVSADLKLLY
ncbi:MAG: DUF2490 domain-containing protein [Phycisphaerales bacterium]|nr:MAG: DUF2490 domain-containing protein [Phycisphaerales bacterium]